MGNPDRYFAVSAGLSTLSEEINNKNWHVTLTYITPAGIVNPAHRSARIAS